MRHALVILALLPLTGCVHRYDVPETSARSLVPGPTVYVSRASDGRDQHPRTYRGSGGQVTEAIVQALDSRGYRVLFGSKSERFKNSLATARDNRAAYVVFPRITLWEDRATEWSGLPDKVHLAIRTLGASGETIDLRRMKATSRWLTLGGDHPQDLLPRLLEEWADGLF